MRGERNRTGKNKDGNKMNLFAYLRNRNDPIELSLDKFGSGVSI
jgi:hypothetical protein